MQRFASTTASRLRHTKAPSRLEVLPTLPQQSTPSGSVHRQVYAAGQCGPDPASVRRYQGFMTITWQPVSRHARPPRRPPRAGGPSPLGATALFACAIQRRYDPRSRESAPDGVHRHGFGGSTSSAGAEEVSGAAVSRADRRSGVSRDLTCPALRIARPACMQYPNSSSFTYSREPAVRRTATLHSMRPCNPLTGRDTVLQAQR